VHTIRTVVLAMTIGVAAIEAGAAPVQEFTHIRPLSPEARALVEDSLQRSPTVLALADALEQTDVVVLVSLSMEPNRTDHGAHLCFVSGGGVLRFVSIWINLWKTIPTVRIALLAHELHHALEVAAAPEVQDSASLARLYRRIGFEGPGGGFESDGARRVEKQVLAELRAGGTRPTGVTRPQESARRPTRPGGSGRP